ncbi:MarR family winged helix-turn-helix transcriptional regulator [Cellulomonas sp. NS3]|uniref:MarR family winged helix-turn-helix transcriptional regulator n=1 Tax=Cellulomonas sp. NS3 TaxID=2973977 RepID=UPI002163C653|nr:MarR family transcriptional regulator [Cellulomonas sp. NS3]
MTTSSSRTLLTAIEDLARAQRETGALLARELDCPRAGLTLVHLLSRLGPQPVGDLAERLRVDISVVSRQVSALVDAGLVHRSAPDGPGADRRVRTVALTARGTELAARSRAHLEERAGEAFAGWTPDELTAAAVQVQKITAAIHSLPPGHHVPTRAGTTPAGTTTAPATTAPVTTPPTREQIPA